jgi:hypothetical protein
MKRDLFCHSDPAVAGEESGSSSDPASHKAARDLSILRIKLRPGRRFAQHDRHWYEIDAVD